MDLPRALKSNANAAAAVLAAAALFVFVNYAGAKFWTQWDWTSSGLYSLSAPTKDLLAGLDRDVHIVSFLLEGGEASPDVVQQIRTLLASFEEAGRGRVKVESIDVRRDPLRAEALIKEFGIDATDYRSLSLVAVRAGARTKQVRLQDMVEFDMSAGFGGQPPVKSLKVEGALANAILAVTRDRQPAIVFATGHGERERTSGAESGLSRFAEALARQDVKTGSWDALGSSAVPVGTDLVVVAGPTVPWLAAERDALRAFLGAGGRALILLDPVLRQADAELVSTGLDPLLAEWGIAADASIVVDPQRGLPFFGPETFHADALGLHPVTSALGGQPALFVLARSLTASATPPAGTTVSALFEFSAGGWGETGFSRLATEVKKESDDRPGPAPVALAAERTSDGKPGGKDDEKPDGKPGGDPGARPGGRLVVVGDADFASNLAIDQLSNRSFALNSVAWLLEENRAFGIEPKDRTLSKLFLTQDQTAVLFVLLVVALPGLAVAAGLGVWWRRRKVL